MAFCIQCGTQVPDGVKFCPSCGAPIAQAPVQQAQTFTAPQVQAAMPQQKKGGSKAGLIIGIVAGVVVIAAVIAAVVIAKNKKK